MDSNARFGAVALALLLVIACRQRPVEAPPAQSPQASGTPSATSEPPPGGPRHEAHHPHEPHAAAAMHHHRHAGGHHRFENADEWAKHFDSPERDAWQRPDAVVGWLALAPDAVVADIGAGTGYFAVRIARAVPQGMVLANDIEPDMVRYVRERADREGLSNVVGILGVGDDPRLDRQVDVAFVCNTYHHIEQRPTFFAKVRERLGSKGRLVIVDFRKDAPEDAPGPPRAMRISADAVAAELAPLGFEVKRRDDQLLVYQYLLELVIPASR